MPRLYAAISMIYRGSNVDLDEFKKTSYVPRRVDVFEEKQNRTAYWNWLKQPPAFTRVKLHKAKAPGSLRRLLFIATLLLTEQRDGLRILRLRDRRQISVNVFEVAIRQHLLAIGRHAGVAGADKGREALVRQRVRRQHLAIAGCDGALPLETVALPAAVFHERGLALGHISRCERRAMTENHASHHSGQRDAKHWITHVVHFPGLARLRPDVNERGLAGFHRRHRLLDRRPELGRILDRSFRPPAHRLRELMILDVRIHDAGADRAHVAAEAGDTVAEARHPLHVHQLLVIAAVV